ncbi:MAG TPA: hypothetical protein VN936_04115, partial [Candidatus Acidoferrum sp.]|nr:hypothetical protein [Candidatus Acidoferrum sp.]
SDEVPLGTSTPQCILYIDPKFYVNPPARSYPIVGIAYLLFYGNNNSVHTQDKVTLIKYLESSAAVKTIKKLEYTPLSASVQNAVITALNGGSNPPCLQ